jgi:hypothetical protein
VVDQTTYEPKQLQIPGIDWDQYNTREIPTMSQIIDGLPDDDYYEALALVLWDQYSLTVKPQILKIADASARRDLCYSRMQARIDAEGARA